MRSLITLAAFALTAAVVVPRHMSNVAPPAPARADGKTVTQIAARSDDASVRMMTVTPDSLGHFRVSARVDARPIAFLIDTGASSIALTARDAATLGIHPAAGDYTISVQTANGTARAARATLDSVEIGNITVRDVAAIVMPEGTLKDNLLGMTFLSRLHRYEYSSGQLVLQQ